MRGKNEGIIHGFPLSYVGAEGPTLSAGNHPPSGWTAITSWGALYIGAEGSTAVNTRVNIRNLQLYVLQKSTGKWLRLQKTSDPDGAAYHEDYSGNANKPADVRHEPDGNISVTAGTGAWAGYNYHFYPRDRASIDPRDVGGVVSVVEARLIVSDPSKPDDRSAAHYLLSSGADYWPDLTSGMPAGQTFQPAVAGGKMKYVLSSWRSFAMTTMTQKQLTANPPAIDLSGILP